MTSPSSSPSRELFLLLSENSGNWGRKGPTPARVEPTSDAEADLTNDIEGSAVELER